MFSLGPLGLWPSEQLHSRAGTRVRLKHGDWGQRWLHGEALNWKMWLEPLLRFIQPLLYYLCFEWPGSWRLYCPWHWAFMRRNRKISKAGSIWFLASSECGLSPTSCLLGYFLCWDYWPEKPPLAKSSFPQSAFLLHTEEGDPGPLCPPPPWKMWWEACVIALRQGWQPEGTGEIWHNAARP